MASISVTVTGGPMIIAKMQARIKQYQQGADRAIQGAGLMTESYAKASCPVDTGRLRSSILYQNKGPCKAQTGTNVKYARPVEFGHVTRNHHSYVKARPYLMPGFARAVSECRDELKSL